MKNVLTAGAALLLSTSIASAVGLDRSGQPVGIIFEEGGATGAYAEFSYGYVSPDISATVQDDFFVGAGTDIDEIAEDYGQFSFGYKRNINDQVSFALTLDEPYGADIQYPDDITPPLVNTAAELNSIALTGILRYKVDDSFSVHGGVRGQRIDADIVLPQSFVPDAMNPPGMFAPNTTVELDDSVAYGFLVGAAYEVPEIALRVALTYFSEVEHEFDTTTVTPLGTVEDTIDVTTPQAVNLDFQTGVAEDTLLFGSIRWAEYEEVIVQPNPLPVSITDIDTGFSYSLGVGRRFSEVFSASLSGTFDSEGDDDLVSPLAPTNGSYSVGVGGQYNVNENVVLSGGVRYVVLGDATIAPGDTEVADAEDNSAIAVGFRVGYNF